MSHTIQSDLAVIGGGAGGLSVAAGAAQLGANVVLIESGKMGGDCLNYGCVPSKSLLAAAKMFHHIKEAHDFGIYTSTLNIDFPKVMKHIREVIAHIAKNDSIERFESLGVNVIKGVGKFINPYTLQAGDYIIKAKRFVIATGSSPFIPPIPGLDQVSYETNETIFNLQVQPTHLIVIGGGPIGCELAQAFSMLGSEVTILEGFKLLPKDEPDCVSIVRKQLEAMNIVIHDMIKVLEVHKSEEGGISVVIEEHGKERIIYGSHLLISTGRRANVGELNLEKVGIVYSPKGIQVDARLRTSNKKIYAIGDVAGSFQFTHIASYHAGIVLRNILFRLPAKVNYSAVPWVTYTEPEIAHVGMLEEEAKKRGGMQVMEWPFAENDRAQAERNTIGKIKIITDKKGKIFGVTIVGNHAGELILPWVIAIREKKTVRMFTDTIAPYPTLSEISKRVSGEFYTPKLFSDKTRWIVKWLLKFGA